MSSDLVVDIPAKYLNSLQDIIESNRTPALLGGFGILEDFERSQAEDRFVKKQIVQRIRERKSNYDTQTSSNAVVDFTNRMLYDKFVALFERDELVRGAKMLICMMNTCPESIPKTKVSKPLDQEIMGIYYSSNINKEVARRLSLAEKRIQQSGLNLHEIIPDNLMYCRLIMEESLIQEKNEIEMPFYIFKLPFICFTTALILCFYVFIIELFTSRILSHITIKTRERQVIRREKERKKKKSGYSLKQNSVDLSFLPLNPMIYGPEINRINKMPKKVLYNHHRNNRYLNNNRKH